jgi:oxepin-CoA hydrolase/3-oxo-5,6-dehydrosuberyl-CoA semialdehyde dehydrogenase
MLEHLEFTYRVASGEIQNFDITTPEKYLERTHETLYNYEKMPRGYDFSLADMSQIEILKHPDLTTAKEKMLEARAAYVAYFKDNDDARTKNAVFGELNRFEWQLMERKHLNHHFEQFNLL